MNLHEGEYIVDIEELGDGWWSGTAQQDGNRAGMFPADYVQLVDPSEVPGGAESAHETPAASAAEEEEEAPAAAADDDSVTAVALYP